MERHRTLGSSDSSFESEESDTDLSGFIVSDNEDESSDEKHAVLKKAKEAQASGKGCFCVKCKKTIQGNMFHFRRHLENVHKNDKKKYKCNECKRAYTTARALKNHLRKHEELRNPEKKRKEDKKKAQLKKIRARAREFLDMESEVVPHRREKVHKKKQRKVESSSPEPRSSSEEKQLKRKRERNERRYSESSSGTDSPPPKKREKRPKKKSVFRKKQVSSSDSDASVYSDYSSPGGRKVRYKKSTVRIVESDSSSSGRQGKAGNRKGTMKSKAAKLKDMKNRKINDYFESMKNQKGSAHDGDQEKQQKKARPIVLQVAGPRLSDYEESRDPLRSVPNDYSAADKALADVERQLQAEGDEGEQVGVSGTTRQQQPNWTGAGERVNWEELGPGTIGGAGSDSEDERQREDTYLREFRADIEDFELPITNGFELNIQLPRGEQLDANFYQRAVARLQNVLRSRSAEIRVETGLLLRSRINYSIRYYYPGKLSELLTFVFDGSEEGENSLKEMLAKLIELDIEQEIWNKFDGEDSSWEMLRILGLRFIVTFR